MDEFSSRSAFLWKAAISTSESHPLIAANLLLRCKRALNETNVGVKLKKIYKTNICQSCGNPWNRGSFNLSVKKRLNKERIRKLQKKSKFKGGKLSKFQQHLLNGFNEEKSCLKICCQMCQKVTQIPIDLPPRSVTSKLEKMPQNEQLACRSNVQSKQVKCKISNQSNLTQNTKSKQSVSMKNQKNSKEVTSSVPAKKKVELSKAQLKNISQNIKKQAKQRPSALTAFLNSIK